MVCSASFSSGLVCRAASKALESRGWACPSMWARVYRTIHRPLLELRHRMSTSTLGTAQVATVRGYR